MSHTVRRDCNITSTHSWLDGQRPSLFTRPHLTAPIPDADLVAICATLIRFDTTNHGGGKSNGERDAADWVAGQLRDAGYVPDVIEAEPGRASTVVRIAGRDSGAPALLVHGHLDVVPAAAQDWSVDPFGGEVREGAVWGRGALDMKAIDAAMLAIALDWARTRYVPPRDVVLAFVADEEDNGELGAGFLVHEHAELFAGPSRPWPGCRSTRPCSAPAG
jgi:acetylornithine deacetylase/succinyl-diaminopimelate desuccinylase-like protein